MYGKKLVEVIMIQYGMVFRVEKDYQSSLLYAC